MKENQGIKVQSRCFKYFATLNADKIAILRYYKNESFTQKCEMKIKQLKI